MKEVKVTDNTIRVVQSTIPVLEQYGDKIASRMYEIIFSANPGLKSVFNMSHQGGTVNPFGSGEQVKILSHALLKYAEYIHDPFTLVDMIEGIVAKHTSLQVKPAHYAVVEAALFGAMRDVLGSSLTPEIEREWRTAYWSLSNLLISMESSVYNEQGEGALGWLGMNKMAITGKRLESVDTVRISLKPCDGRPAPKRAPGQYISVFHEGLNITRQYSLISVEGDSFEIGVRLACSGEHKGEMSRYFIEDADLGDVLQVAMPAGGYKLEGLKGGDVCLLSAGSGVTPHLALLDHLSRENYSGDVHHFYSVKDSDRCAFSAYRKQLTERCNFFEALAFSAPKPEDNYGFDYQVDGRIDADILKAVLRHPLDTHYFICGPNDYVQDMIALILEFGVPRTKIQYDCFSSTPVAILGIMAEPVKPGSKCVFATMAAANQEPKICPM